MDIKMNKEGIKKNKNYSVANINKKVCTTLTDWSEVGVKKVVIMLGTIPSWTAGLQAMVCSHRLPKSWFVR